ncbi:MAG: hypothetical protein AM326_11725 [Candidatus Thorarchaeota archaeon SMTZ-45]|nr:MAG: hypothetical protein AM326_11725 [Candidatus Thorarchaeota archaeon SMTZ-45]KXH75350.1 MAG: hypothetical protein AM325_16230 [Candidatus Thorarchaeota archaeon SMTZ1-45]
MSQVTPARYAVKKMLYSHRAKSAMLVYVRSVYLQKMTSASIVRRQNVRSVRNFCHLVHAIHAENWSVKTTE